MNRHAIAMVVEAVAGLEHYFVFYNHQRPHQALAYRTPAEVYFRPGKPPGLIRLTFFEGLSMNFKEFSVLYSQIQLDMADWSKTLHESGVLFFTIGFACLGTNHPVPYAIVALLICGLHMMAKVKQFSTALRQLREKKKDDYETVLLSVIEKTFFGFNLIKNHPLYFLSWFFLGFIAMGWLK